MLTEDVREKIIKAILADAANHGSDSKCATAYGIHKSVFSRVKKGEKGQLLSDGILINAATKLRLTLGDAPEIHTAQTQVYSFITTQLQFCKDNHTTGIYCDYSDIGKTHTGKEFALKTKYTAYVDCSQVKTKREFVRQIAKEFGVEPSGKYSDVYAGLIWCLKSLENPLVILDEAGDLDYPAFLELKAMWNATEGRCGWYMMGADGLSHKIDRGIANKRVGFTEIFNRYGAKYQWKVPKESTERKVFFQKDAAQIIMENLPSASNREIATIVQEANGSLRRVCRAIQKAKTTIPQPLNN